tara:strand:- start:507 stop:887 length:381 start_codon:yes stop_codon:yes gene_type:complete
MRQIEEICVFYKKGKYIPQTTIKDKPIICTNTGGNYYERTQKKTFTNNLNYPTHVLEYKRRNHKYSTRPVELCEYMINTYTNENDLVLDLTCSDGQSGIACKKLNRNYIGVDHSESMISDALKNNE